MGCKEVPSILYFRIREKFPQEYTHNSCCLYFLIHVQPKYVQVGELKINSVRLMAARKAPDAYRMARKLLPEFFTEKEMSTCMCVPPKPGAKITRPQADSEKLELLLGI